MGELVDDLVSKGYLERHEDPADRRAKRIYLTGKGRAHPRPLSRSVMLRRPDSSPTSGLPVPGRVLGTPW
jgi:Winged helix DNA-binding domain